MYENKECVSRVHVIESQWLKEENTFSENPTEIMEVEIYSQHGPGREHDSTIPIHKLETVEVQQLRSNHNLQK